MTSNSLEMSGNFFTFRNKKSECHRDVYHLDDRECYSLGIKAIPDEVVFAYAPAENQRGPAGLIELDQNGAIKRDSKPMEVLLALDTSQPEPVMNFIKTYGFFVPLPTDRFQYFDFQQLRLIIEQMKATCALMRALKTEPFGADYNALLENVLFLQFLPKVSLSTGEDGCVLQSWYTKARRYWDQDNESFPSVPSEYYLLPASPDDPQKPDLDDHRLYIAVKDPFTEEFEYLPAIHYSTIDQMYAALSEPNDKPHTDLLYYKEEENDISRRIALRFVNARTTGQDETVCQLYDYLYHFTKELAAIEEFDEQSRPVLSDDHPFDQLGERDDIPEAIRAKFRTELVELARLTLKEVMDGSLRGVYPAYNTTLMQPEWEIPDLKTAVYFSLFYMSSDEIYRKCQNPTCNRLFKISTTNMKKKFCGDPCRNLVNQRKYQKKKKAKEMREQAERLDSDDQKT